MYSITDIVSHWQRHFTNPRWTCMLFEIKKKRRLQLCTMYVFSLDIYIYIYISDIQEDVLIGPRRHYCVHEVCYSCAFFLMNVTGEDPISKAQAYDATRYTYI